MKQPLKTREDVIQFFDYLIKDEKTNFHPDDNFETYINLSTERPTFEKSKAIALNARMDEAKKITGNKIYDLAQASVDKNYAQIKSVGGSINMKPRTMFASGGALKTNSMERVKVFITGYPWWLEKIDHTHLFLSNSEEAKGNAMHVNQLLKRNSLTDNQFYKDVAQWLNGTLDIADKQYGEFAHGGAVASGGALKTNSMERVKVFITGYPWWLEKIDHTHLFLSNSEEAKGNAMHVNQLLKRNSLTDNQFYKDVAQWLNGTLDIADKQYGEFAHGGAVGLPAISKVETGLLLDTFPVNGDGVAFIYIYEDDKYQVVKWGDGTVSMSGPNILLFEKDSLPYDPVHEAEKADALDFVPEEDRWMAKGGMFEQLSVDEKQLLQILNKKNNATVDSIERIHTLNSGEKEYNFYYSGTYKTSSGFTYPFRAWLPLSAIRDLVDWSKPEIAAMSDYPQMVNAGDWSGIRDTNRKSLWKIFDKYVLKKNSFKVGDIVYNKKHNTVGIVRDTYDNDFSGEIRTNEDGNVYVSDLEIYTPQNKKHTTAKVSPSTLKELGWSDLKESGGDLKSTYVPSNQSDYYNPKYLFADIVTELLSAIALGKIDAKELAIKELEDRGYNAHGEWVGFGNNIRDFEKKAKGGALNSKELRVFTKNCEELIGWVKANGIPSITKVELGNSPDKIFEFMMNSRLQSIKQRPELLQEAQKIDKDNVLLLKDINVNVNYDILKKRLMSVSHKKFADDAAYILSGDLDKILWRSQQKPGREIIADEVIAHIKANPKYANAYAEEILK